MTTRKQLSREQINIKREVEYIVRRAAERDARVVTLGPLVFFSTETGDAWLLDPSDHLALCLARDGDPRPVNITESEGTFAIGWEMTYQISDDQFIVADQSSQSRTIIGYPVREIAHAIQRPQEFKRGDRPEVARQIEQLVDTGYDLLLGPHRQTTAACDKWLEAWDLVKRLARSELRTVDALDRAYFQGRPFVANWATELMFELHNAGIDDPIYHEHRWRYVQEFLARFSSEDADTQVEFNRGQGEALWALGRRAEAEAVYASLIEQFPDKGWAYIGWSDHYWQWGAPDPKEYDRAEALLQQALARPRLEDRADVLERLCSLYAEWEQKDKLAEAVAQLEQAAKKG